jgi:thiol-disulfide isomerase/thioredoxin
MLHQTHVSGALVAAVLSFATAALAAPPASRPQSAQAPIAGAASLANQSGMAGRAPLAPLGGTTTGMPLEQLVKLTPTPSFIDVSAADYDKSVAKAHAGRVLVVNFWANYCKPCLDEMPGLVQLAERLKKDGVDLVFVDVDPKSRRADSVKVLTRLGLGISSYGVTDEDPQPFIDIVDKGWAGEVPFTVLYDKKGNRAQSLSGEQSPAVLEAAVRKVLAQP